MSNSELMKNRHTMEINAISELVIFETATNNSKYLFIFHLKFEDTEEEEKYQQQLLLSVITIHDTLKEEFRNKKFECFGGVEDTEIESCPYNTFICLTVDTSEFTPREIPILLKLYLEALQSNIDKIAGRHYDEYGNYVIGKHQRCLSMLKTNYTRDEKECGKAVRRVQITLLFNREPSHIAMAHMAQLHMYGWINDMNNKNIVYMN